MATIVGTEAVGETIETTAALVNKPRWLDKILTPKYQVQGVRCLQPTATHDMCLLQDGLHVYEI